MGDLPRTLLIETSGRTGLVGVARGDELLAEVRLDPGRRHVRDLAPAVRSLLRQVGWVANEVGAVVVSRGPGSYTGLRVGIMAAKAFAYATGCALVAVDTFAVIAERQADNAVRTVVIADAQRGLLYCQRFTRRPDASHWRPESDLEIVQKDVFLNRLAPDTYVTGPGVDVIDGDLPAGVRRAPPAGRHPDLPALLRVGLGRYSGGARDDVWACEPLYLRPSSAEENWPKHFPQGRPSGAARPDAP
jgi:tRNA threonylcarbamoyladenosine biosynthesis protein TsaB